MKVTNWLCDEDVRLLREVEGYLPSESHMRLAVHQRVVEAEAARDEERDETPAERFRREMHDYGDGDKSPTPRNHRIRFADGLVPLGSENVSPGSFIACLEEIGFYSPVDSQNGGKPSLDGHTIGLKFATKAVKADRSNGKLTEAEYKETPTRRFEAVLSAAPTLSAFAAAMSKIADSIGCGTVSWFDPKDADFPVQMDGRALVFCENLRVASREGLTAADACSLRVDLDLCWTGQLTGNESGGPARAIRRIPVTMDSISFLSLAARIGGLMQAEGRAIITSATKDEARYNAELSARKKGGAA